MRNQTRIIPSFCQIVSVGMALAPLASGLGAATFVVTTEMDDNGLCEAADCALREAVIAANANPGLDTIILPAGTYRLTIIGPVDNAALTGDLDILDDLKLQGENSQSTVILGDGTDRVFNILETNVEISRVTITGGASFSSGGGIRAEVSQVTIVDSMIVSNSTTEDGGGIFFGVGNLLLINSTVSDNSAGDDGFGGGIQVLGVTSSDLTLINSTVSGNAAFSGGGLSAWFDSNLTLIHSTLANNTASFRGSAYANQFSHQPTFFNTLIVGDCAIGSRPPMSNGGNIESPGDSCQLNRPDDRHTVPNPGIGPLTDNGGPTPTHALLPGSPAIDSAVDADCQATDQRKLSRPRDGDLDGVASCDVGAYELSPQVAIPALSPASLLGLAMLLAWSALAALAQARSEAPVGHPRPREDQPDGIRARRRILHAQRPSRVSRMTR